MEVTLRPRADAATLPVTLNRCFWHDECFYVRHDPVSSTHRQVAVVRVEATRVVGRPKLGIVMWDPDAHDAYWHSTWKTLKPGVTQVTCDAQLDVYFTYGVELREGDSVTLTSFKANSVELLVERPTAEEIDTNRMLAALSYLERNDLKCLICWSPLQHNLETPCCKTFFCAGCLRQWAEKAAGIPRCPNCSGPFQLSDCTHNVRLAPPRDDVHVSTR